MTKDATDQFKMTMSVRYLDSHLKDLQESGYKRDRALEILGLNDWDFKNPEARVHVSRVEDMYLDASEVLDDPLIGLRTGYNFRVPTFAKTGIMFSYCEDMAQVFEMNRKYQRVSVDVGEGQYLVEDDRHFFAFDSYPEAQSFHHVLGMIFGAYATAFRWLTWSTGKGLKAVTLVRPEPEDSSLYHEAVKCPLTFDAVRNAVEFYPETMREKLPTRNPEKLAYAVSLLDSVLNKTKSTESFKSAVRASIRGAIGNGAVSLGIIADRLDMPERKLRRELKGKGLSYRDLLDRERKSLFQEGYRRGKSFAEIAQDLGYNDQAAFSRAFKRWYGMAPGAYTHANQAATPQ